MKAEESPLNSAESIDWKIVLGDLNPHLSVSVSAPPDVANIELIAEGNEPC